MIASRTRGVAAGILRPVDYSAPVLYRRPPELYRRLQPVGFGLAAAGLVPRYVVVLEVLGRRSRRVRRTTLVRATLDDGDYLVSLSGQSQWVRNVRAAGGHVVILADRQRRPATLVEVPPAERPPVIRAYLSRAGRSAASPAAAREARFYFGVAPQASDDQLLTVAARYPVFRIVPGRADDAPTVGSRASTPPPHVLARPADRRIGRAVEALSAAGYPATQSVIRRFGKSGAAVVELVCLGLLARDAALIARGTTRVLRTGPAILLWLECALAGVAAASNAHLLAAADVQQQAAQPPYRTAERVRRAATAGLFVLHTLRFHIYLRPDQGRRAAAPTRSERNRRAVGTAPS